MKVEIDCFDVGGSSANRRSPALCIDLDGTLLKSDLLLESVLALLAKNPFLIFVMPFWLFAGKAAFKRKIADQVELDVTTLPYDQRVVEMLRNAEGRTRVLCTASDRLLVEPIAEHLGLFELILASDGRTNLAGRKKALALVEIFGERGYDYAGNAPIDRSVWSSARGAWVVNAGKAVVAIARSQCDLLGHLPRQHPVFKGWLKAIRLHQWLKNILIFVPLIASHRFMEIQAVGDALLAFLGFGLCASSVYVVNDLLDIQVDRKHKRKRHRPFASAGLSIPAGMTGAILLGACGLGISLLVSRGFVAVLGTYYVLTLAYSLKLKRMAVIDVVLLAGLYTVRIVAGAAAIGSELSFWLLAFSMFIFLSLALVKRYAELEALIQDGRSRIAGRDYQASDLGIIGSLGAAAGYLAVLVLAMYINSPESLELYASPKLLWALCPLFLYWISRMWFIAGRGGMHDDPIVFAVGDVASRIVGGATLVVVFAATVAW